MKKAIFKTKQLGIETGTERQLRQVIKLLFFAAGKTGGRFKIEAAASARYDASSADLTVLEEQDSRNNGDVHITIIRDRDTADHVPAAVKGLPK